MIRLWLPATTLAAVLALGACGATPPPGEAVPALRTRLERVDATLAEGHYADARQALDALTRETVTARDRQAISAEQAQRILAAIARLVTDLPAPAPTPPPSATVEPSQNNEADEGSEPSENENKHEDKGKDEEKKEQKDGEKGKS